MFSQSKNDVDTIQELNKKLDDLTTRLHYVNPPKPMAGAQNCMPQSLSDALSEHYAKEVKEIETEFQKVKAQRELLKNSSENPSLKLLDEKILEIEKKLTEANKKLCDQEESNKFVKDIRRNRCK